MSTANTSALNVSDLDFFSIRNNLKEFLRSQDTFTDYDFEGSGLSVLLDVLAYNTYYNSFYMNMIANESFLDTAQIRSNILSHAKMINYIPTSMKGAIARIDVLLTPSPNENRNLNVVTLGSYTRLTGTDTAGVPHPFITIDSTSAYKANGQFYFPNVAIQQGQVITQQYLCNANNFSRQFVLPSANVDTSTIKVSVQESASNTFITEYKLSEDMTTLSSNSQVYFVEEDQNEQWKVYFGDGIIGYRPKDGNIVQVSYIETNGAMANDVMKFGFVDPIAGIYKDSISVITTQKAYGGADKEDIDKIRFHAPQYYAAQNRAVTVDDYESIITKNYTNIDTVAVWGGEENDPPEYGKVFISLKTKGYYTLTNFEKENIRNQLIKNINVMTVTPELIDPDYMFILVKGTVTYNPNITSKSSTTLLGIVNDAIMNYAETELNTFKSTFRKSKLQSYIESSDIAITGSDIDIVVQKRVTLSLQKNVKYNISFNTPLLRSDYVTKNFFTFPSMSVYDKTLALQNVTVTDIPNANTGVAAITITKSGHRFLEPPIVVISGDGVGANAYAVLSGDRVSNIVVDRPGINYTHANISIIGGGGTQAEANAILEEDIGALETFYIEPNGAKIVVNPYAGTIDYANGTAIISVSSQASANNPFYEDGVMTFNAIPKSQIIPPGKNRIITLDVNNPQSIQINMVAQPE